MLWNRVVWLVWVGWCGMEIWCGMQWSGVGYGMVCCGMVWRLGWVGVGCGVLLLVWFVVLYDGVWYTGSFCASCTMMRWILFGVSTTRWASKLISCRPSPHLTRCAVHIACSCGTFSTAAVPLPGDSSDHQGGLQGARCGVHPPGHLRRSLLRAHRPLEEHGPTCQSVSASVYLS